MSGYSTILSPVSLSLFPLLFIFAYVGLYSGITVIFYCVLDIVFEERFVET